MTPYVALYRKYRPNTFAELVGQEPIAQTLAGAIDKGKIGHAYLFCGPRGTGKTSVARILAKSVSCAQGPTSAPCGICDSCREITAGTSLDVFEIDAASNNGVDNIRDVLSRVTSSSVRGNFRIYIIDEVHMLSQGAFNALLKTLEEPPPRIMFILATTDPHKVLPTIVSRCQRFDFGRIGLGPLIGRLDHVAKAEGIPAEAGALEAIARRANGGLRDALSLLDQLAASTGGAMLTADAVSAGLGLVSGDQLVALGDAVVRGDVPLALEVSAQLLAAGHEHGTVIRELLVHFRHLLILQLAPERASQLDVPMAHQAAMTQQAAAVPAAELPWILEALNETEGVIRRSPQQAIWLELGLIKVARRPAIASLVELSERVAALEAAAGGQPLPARPAPRPVVPAGAPAARPVAFDPPPATAPGPVAVPMSPSAASVGSSVAAFAPSAPAGAAPRAPLASPTERAFDAPDDGYFDAPAYDDRDVPPPPPDDNFEPLPAVAAGKPAARPPVPPAPPLAAFAEPPGLAPLPPAPPLAALADPSGPASAPPLAAVAGPSGPASAPPQAAIAASPGGLAPLPPAPPNAFDTPALGQPLAPRPPLEVLDGGAAPSASRHLPAGAEPVPPAFAGGAQRPIPPGAWERLLEHVRAKSVPTAAMLSQQAVIDRWEADGSVIMRMGKAFKETFERTASKKQILVDATAAVFGPGCHPRIEVGDGKGGPGAGTKPRSTPNAHSPVDPGFGAPAGGFGAPASPSFAAPPAPAYPPSPSFAAPPAPAYPPSPSFAAPPAPSHQPAGAAHQPPAPAYHPPPPFDDPPPPEEPGAWLDDHESSRPPDVRPDEATAIARPAGPPPAGHGTPIAPAPPSAPGPRASAGSGGAAASKASGGSASGKGSGEKKEWRRRDQEAPPPARPLKLPDDPALRLAVELFNGRVIAATDAPTQVG